MTLPRVLLIECVDAAGAAPRDLRPRALALQRAGFRVRPVVVEPAATRALQPQPPLSGKIDQLYDDARGHERALHLLEKSAAGITLVASAHPGGGKVGGWFTGTRGARWWPTALGADGASHATPGGSLQSIGAGNGFPTALELMAYEPARPRRGHLPLWDGDYVLIPAPLHGRSGGAALAAFAALLDEHPGIDLVVLADPQPAFTQMASGLGIGLRVHFVGSAPRDAEIAWIGGAACALLAGDGPVSVGLVLRVLARGIPLLTAEGGLLADELAPWLEHHGCLAGRVDAISGPQTLERTITRQGETQGAAARGIRVATDATSEVLATRLAGLLIPPERTRRAA